MVFGVFIIHSSMGCQINRSLAVVNTENVTSMYAGLEPSSLHHSVSDEGKILLAWREWETVHCTVYNVNSKHSPPYLTFTINKHEHRVCISLSMRHRLHPLHLPSRPPWAEIQRDSTTLFPPSPWFLPSRVIQAVKIWIDTSLLSLCSGIQNMLGLSEYAPAFRIGSSFQNAHYLQKRGQRTVEKSIFIITFSSRRARLIWAWKTAGRGSNFIRSRGNEALKKMQNNENTCVEVLTCSTIILLRQQLGSILWKRKIRQQDCSPEFYVRG